MRVRTFSLVVLAFVLPLLAVSAYGDPVLGFAASYAVLAKSGITNPTTNADTLVSGDMGLSPAGAAACTGFVLGTGCTAGPGMVTGATHLTDAPAAQAIAAAQTAYIALGNTPSNFSFSCLGLGVTCGNNLAPGVYNSTQVSTLLHGALTLVGDGKPNDLWIFQTAFGLTTDSLSSVLVLGAGTGAGLYWQVGSKATLGDNSKLLGNWLAGTEIAFDPGAQITCGRAFAQSAVTFAGNNPATSLALGGVPNKVGFDNCSGLNGGTIVPGTGGGPGTVIAPEPGTFALLSFGLLAMVFLTFRKSFLSSLSY